MIKSMTGFGRGEVMVDNKKIVVEVRTLNSKQLDLNLRIPSIYRSVEFDVRSLLTKSIVRGKVDAQVVYEAGAVQQSSQINKELLAAYVEQYRDAIESANIDTHNSAMESVIVSNVLRMSDITTSQTQAVSDEECAAVIEATKLALEGLNSFREQEGAILIADMIARVDKIEEFKEQVTPFEQARVDIVRARIFDNISNLKVDVDSSRLEQEMIFYIEKLDITEEKVRLKNHCKYFREQAMSEQEQGVGRKLGFIAQEMGREINTMGSKANEQNIQRLVVNMKDELEKIKEQSLNIL